MEWGENVVNCFLFSIFEVLGTTGTANEARSKPL